MLQKVLLVGLDAAGGQGHSHGHEEYAWHTGEYVHIAKNYVGEVWAITPQVWAMWRGGVVCLAPGRIGAHCKELC